MAELTYQEKKIIEDQLIQGGYVLHFSDRTFQDFFGDIINIDINDPKYSENNSGSKGNRLKSFIRIESNYAVGKILEAFFDEIVLYNSNHGIVKTITQYLPFKKIYLRLLSDGSIVEHIDAIQANNDDKDFHQLARLIKDSIEKNEPEAALDRLHTFLFKFLKELCKSHDVEFAKEETINAIFGKYIKGIRAKGFIESEMAEKIIQSTFQIIQAFNDIRNNRSFAHDNPILNYEESVLIFSNVTATVKFIQSIETKFKNAVAEEAKPDWGGF